MESDVDGFSCVYFFGRLVLILSAQSTSDYWARLQEAQSQLGIMTFRHWVGCTHCVV